MVPKRYYFGSIRDQNGSFWWTIEFDRGQEAITTESGNRGKNNMMIESIRNEYRRYKALAEKSVAQVKDEDLHKVFGEDANSIAVVLNHLSGNLKSRFTNFRTEDGEKPWRRRDEEFEEKIEEERSVLLEKWDESWEILLRELDSLTDGDLDKVVRIRGQELTISDALLRSVAHLAYHVGQIVCIARIHTGSAWQSLSIPRGKSQEYTPESAKGKGSNDRA